MNFCKILIINSSGAVYTKSNLIDLKAKFYENRIAKDTEKKKKLLDNLKEITVVSLASKLNCKPYELDEVIVKEYELIQKII